jgi:outer membrane protein OmpA-like peptidoglycan-associated protein
VPQATLRTVRTAFPLVLVVLAAVACTADENTPPEPTAVASSNATAASTAEAVAPVTAEVVLRGEPVTLEVGPVAVADGVGVLRVAGPKDAMVSVLLQEVFVSLSPGASGVRLVDLEQGTVALPARVEGDSVLASWVRSVGGPATDAAASAAGADTEVLYVGFAAPTTPTVDALLPAGGGLVEGVPVVDAADAGVLTVPVAEIEEEAVVSTPVVALDAYTERVGGQVRTRTTAQTVTVAIGSDVLFGVDSADLGARADGALAAAAQELEAYDGGELTVVGHTDDVADDAYNQKLSERRAQAVADRLRSVADLGAFEISVEGLGESEPAAPGTSEESRAVNRRVELVLTTEQAAQAETTQEPSGRMPRSEGPTASALESVTVDSGNDVPVDVRVVEVRRVDRYLVGTLEVSNTAGPEAASGSLFATGAWDARGSFDPSLQAAATNVTLLHGDERLYPVDYVSKDDSDQRDPLADRFVFGPEPDHSTLVTVVWPDPGTDTVVVDSPAKSKEIGSSVAIDITVAPFRITDVPVTTDAG